MDDPAAMAKDRQKRMLLMKKNLKARDWMGDKSLEHIHEVSYDLPEECLFFLSNDLPFTFNFLYALFIEADEFFNEVKVIKLKSIISSINIVVLLLYFCREMINTLK